jgi:hypothetical protein
LSEGKIPTIMDTVRHALLRRCVTTITFTLDQSLRSPPTSQSSLTSIGKAAAKQLFVDVACVKASFADRHGFGQGDDIIYRELSQLVDKVSTHCGQMADIPILQVEDLVKAVFTGSNAWLTSLLGESIATSISATDDSDLSLSSSTSTPIFRMPLVSSVRFNVLPVQADRSLNEIQLREKYAKEKEAPRSESLGGSVMSSGLGFMSSGLGFFKGKN